MAENKKSGLSILLGGLLAFFALTSMKKDNKGSNTGTQTQQTGNNTGSDQFLNELPENFTENNGVASPIASQIIPFIVPSSFVIEVVKNKYYVQDYDSNGNEIKTYYNGTKISFLLCIHVPNTSLGSLQIEDVEIKDLQFVKYINDQQQEWINPFATPEYSNELKTLANQLKGKTVNTGYNLFEIVVEFGPYRMYDALTIQSWATASYEAISMGLNIKYSETRLAHWRLLSAWNIQEDELINGADSLGTNTRFGVVRNYQSKPRAGRGLFSEWWAEYLANGYNTNITKISAV